MLEGLCPKCGMRRIGWALRIDRYQTCPRCGTGLVITEDGRPVAHGYSPFEAAEYHIESPPDERTDLESKKSGDEAAQN